MTLTPLDWAAIAGYLLITLILGLYFRRKSGQSTADYFVSGRNVSWWLAGTSMVATTFAADTPLVVTGLDRWFVQSKPCIVHKDIDTAKAFHHGVETGLNACRIADIEREGNRLDAFA